MGKLPRADTLFDPTENVLNLVESSIKRLDDLHSAAIRRVDDIAALREKHAKELAEAEAKRIDAIRAVDVNAVAVANEKAAGQAAVLARQVTESADALRSLVATTAATMASASERLSSQFTERLSALERAQNVSAGRQGMSTTLLILISTFGGGIAVFLIERLLK